MSGNKMCIRDRVCAQPKGDGDDYLKRVNIRIQTVFKLDVAACLVVVQHVRFEDGFDLSLIHIFMTGIIV